MTKVNGGFPVQETSREEMSSEMDPGYFPKTHLSQEETPHTPLNRGPNPKISKNTKTSAETSKCEHVTINKTQEASVEFTLDDNGSTVSGHKGNVAGKPNDNTLSRHGENASNHRIDHIDIYTAPPSGKLEDEANTDKSNTIDRQNKTPTDPGRNNDDFSFSEETDVKEDHGKAFDGTRPNKNSSGGLGHDSNAKEVIGLTNHPTMTLRSEGRATAGSEEDSLTLESHSSNNSVTTVFGSGNNGDVGCKNTSEQFAHHEVNTIVSGGGQTGGNASNLNIDDSISPDIYTAPPSGKLEGEANMDKSNNIDLQNKTPTDPGRNNDDFSCCRPTCVETDAKEDHGKAFDGTRPNENSSTGLEHDSNAKEVIGLANHPTMTVTSEDSATAGSEEDNLTLESHRSNNSDTKVFGSGHNGDVGCKNTSEQFAHHEVNTIVSGGGQTGGNASNFRTVDDANIKCYTTTPSGKLQSEANMDTSNTIDLQNKTSTDPGRNNNDSLSRRPNIGETDVKEGNGKALDGNIPNNGSSTGCHQDINVIGQDNHTTMSFNHFISKSEDSSPVGSETNNTETKVIESGHNGDGGDRPSGEIFAHHEVKNRFSATSQTGGNVSSFRIDDGIDRNTYNTTTCCGSGAKKDTNNPMVSEIKTSTDRGRDSNNFSCHESNIKETDAKEGKSKTFNGTYRTGRRKDQSPEENISSSHGRDNNGLSRHRPKSQRQSCDSLATAIPTDAQQDGTGSAMTTLDDHVSLPRRSRICFPSEIKMDERSHSKRSSRGRNPRNTIKGLLLTLYILIMFPIAAAAPAQVITSQWRSFEFCAEKGSILGQFGNFRNMEDRTANSCTVSFTRARFYNNCLEYGYLIFRINETCVEMLAEDLNTTHYTMEYKDTANGNTSNGHSVDGTAGEQLTGAEVTAKIAEYIDPLKTTTRPLKGDNTTTPPLQQKRSHEGIFGLLVPVIGVPILYVLLYSYKNCVKFKRCVDSRGRNTNSASNTDNNGEDIPLQDIPNGHMNGRVPDEESQKQN